MSQQRGPADNLKDAYNRLELDLRNPTDFEAYYHPRGAKAVDELRVALQTYEGCAKVLYSGHARSGKTTELFRLMRDLSDEFYPVYFSVESNLEIADVTYTDVLLTMALELVRQAHGVRIPDFLEHRIRAWIEQVTGEIEVSEERQCAHSKEVSGSLKAWVVEAGAKYQLQASTREEVRSKLEPRSEEIISTIGELVALYQAEIRRKPLVIVDDLEKADLSIARGTFAEHSASLRSPACDTIYTIPIALAFSGDMTSIRNQFTHYVVLPMMRITHEDGSVDQQGRSVLQEILLKRAKQELLEPDAIAALIQGTGGIVAEMLRVGRDACLRAIVRGAETVSADLLNEVLDDLTRDYWRMLDRKYYPELEAAARQKDAPDDDSRAHLMHMLAILQYDDDPGWYDVHPAVRKLLVQEGMLGS